MTTWCLVSIMNKTPSIRSYLYEASSVVAIQISDDEALFRGKLELVDARLQESVRSHLLKFLRVALGHFRVLDVESHLGPQGIVDVHERVAPPQGPPDQRDGIIVASGLVLLFDHPTLEARNGAQAQLQLQTSLEERGVLVGTLVENVGRLLGCAVDGRGRREAGRGPAKERRGARGLGALGVARAVVRVAGVLALVALVALVGHEGRPAAGV